MHEKLKNHLLNQFKVAKKNSTPDQKIAFMLPNDVLRGLGETPSSAVAYLKSIGFNAHDLNKKIPGISIATSLSEEHFLTDVKN